MTDRSVYKEGGGRVQLTCEPPCESCHTLREADSLIGAVIIHPYFRDSGIVTRELLLDVREHPHLGLDRVCELLEVRNGGTLVGFVEKCELIANTHKETQDT
jgi:hypothetical protein